MQPFHKHVTSVGKTPSADAARGCGRGMGKALRAAVRRVLGLGACVALPVVAVAALALPARADQSDLFFNDATVKEIRLTFADPNWYTTLYNAHANDNSDPSFPASFTSDGVTIAQIGVRMKGFSSFTSSGTKKPFKLDFDYYDAPGTPGELATKFRDLKKLNLNNSVYDPTMLREKLFMDFAGQFVPSPRAVHCRLYINNAYYGLYVAMEQVDKTFIKNRFGDGQDGNLWKGAAPDDIDNPGQDFGSTLEYLGATQTPYYAHYQLKTNEEENDYSRLINFINVLNNTAAANMPTAFPPIADVDNILYGLAVSNLFSHLDSYTGSAHNYYLYDREDTGQMVHILWDANMSFGRFSYGGATNLLQLNPLWLPTTGSFSNARPLESKLWAVPAWKTKYLRDIAQMMRSGFDTATMQARIDRLANLIRTDVYADTRKFYSNSQFETNLYNDTGGIYGLRNFVTQRATYMNTQLNTFAVKTDITLNELMPVNTATIQDNAGEYAPWLELYNLGPGLVSLSGLYLTDTTALPQKWALPASNLDDGLFLTIWMDGQTAQGTNHANFTLNAAGGSLYLYNGTTLVTSVTYPALAANAAYARTPNGEGAFAMTNRPTPGASNLAYLEPPTTPPTLFVNEVMASNATTIQNPDAPGTYEDWFEIYNPGDLPVNMEGLYVTDNLSNRTKYRIPAGVFTPPHGYLIIWADDHATGGPTHASFKLSASGEAVGLVHRDGTTLIDSITFGVQSTDVAYGRSEDGAGSWGFMAHATPGTSNNPPAPCGTADFNGDGDTGTDQDIEAFFACLAGNCCATCFSGGADFNRDGDIGTDADIESFFRVLAGGTC